MTSQRLKWVYNTARWRGPIRNEVIRRAGGRCEAVHSGVFGQVRCSVRDRLAGGKAPLIIDHIDPYHADPFELSNLQALCHKHSGQKDGGRRATRS